MQRWNRGGGPRECFVTEYKNNSSLPALDWNIKALGYESWVWVAIQMEVVSQARGWRYLGDGSATWPSCHCNSKRTLLVDRPLKRRLWHFQFGSNILLHQQLVLRKIKTFIHGNTLVPLSVLLRWKWHLLEVISMETKCPLRLMA